MRSFKLVDGEPESPDQDVEISATFTLASPGGFFRAAAVPGQTVKANATLATIVDHFGDTVEVIKAPPEASCCGCAGGRQSSREKRR
jgi:uncharacterized protein